MPKDEWHKANMRAKYGPVVYREPDGGTRKRLGKKPKKAKSANRVSFGQHKGRAIHEIPDRYLQWCLTVKGARGRMKALQQAARKQLRWREKQAKEQGDVT